MKSTLYYLHALSPLHVGTGQDAGAIDLPIAREKATNLPYVPGTGLKGMLRAELNPANADMGWMTSLNEPGYVFPTQEDWQVLFGTDTTGGDNDFAGSVTFGDAHLLCLPVRSLAGTFAWATCPFILARYAREAKACGMTDLPGEKLSLHDGSNGKNAEAMVASGSVLVHDNKTVVLEDLDLVKKDGADNADKWAKHIAEIIFKDQEKYGETWQTMFKQRFVILPDGVLDFLAETATEVRARVKINEKRVVQKGALWYEENLPAESLLFGLVAADRSRNKDKNLSAEEVLAKLPNGPVRLQLGGKMTVGRGLVNWIKGGAK